MAEMSSPRGLKTALRRQALAARSCLQPAERSAAARLVAETGLAWLTGQAQGPLRIAGYRALRDELDPLPLMEALVRQGHMLTLPRMVADDVTGGEGGSLAFHAYEIGDPLEKGAFGVEEPRAAAAILVPDVILAPLVAFDRRGHRLGYGKGFYDRALARYPGACGIGLAFAVQEVEQVPDEPHDRPLMAIITERGVIVPG